MKYGQYFSSHLTSVGLNQYLADTAEQLVEILSSDPEEDIINTLLHINENGYLYIEDYHSLPSGTEGDLLFLKIEQILKQDFMRFVNTHIDLLNRLAEDYMENGSLKFIGKIGGIWIEWNED